MWAIDFEASGLTRTSYPIEVGITNGQSEYHALIKPYEHWSHWSTDAEQIHHISRATLLAEGTSPGQVAREVNKILAGKNVYCDSHHWDSFWCNALFSDSGMSPSFKLLDIQDLVSSCDRILEAFLEHKSKLEHSGRFSLHRALDDAKIIQESAIFALSSRHEE